MTLKPGTGSANAANGNPGVIYIGDVGHYTWEELNVATGAGMNFGWPLFEGLEPHSGGYYTLMAQNKYAPNPLYGVSGCTQQYFYFQDLLKQATASGTANFANPCNTTQTIPSSIKTFVHSRPIIDWKHGSAGPSRTGTFSGETATLVNIGAAGSPVSGPQFGGSSSSGGIFYTHDDFPAEYKNAYFFGDYVGGWIRNLTEDGSYNPVAVKSFINSGAVVVAMAAHPTQGGIYYVNFPSEIRKVTYNSSNLPPVAVASADKVYGTSPLTVQFTGSNSTDSNGQTLTYLWDFGDGTTSTAANPSHSFTSSSPINRTVTLTVKDTQGSTDQATLVISVGNTPPVVSITSPIDNTLYPLTAETTYNLRANVTDQEHSSNQLSYQWQTILHHEDHEHPEPFDSSPETTTTIDPIGCDREKYYYRIVLKVTDALGLSATDEIRLYPDCSTTGMQVLSFTLVDADTEKDIKILTTGETLNLATLPSRNLNIRANTSPPTIMSVIFNLTGTLTRNVTENSPPYTLFGDNSGNYNAWRPAVGSYTLKGTP